MLGQERDDPDDLRVLGESHEPVSWAVNHAGEILPQPFFLNLFITLWLRKISGDYLNIGGEDTEFMRPNT
jgi:hypothetical protein